MDIQFLQHSHKGHVSGIIRTKYILLLVVMLFVKHSFAQTEVPTDSLNQTISPVPDQIVKDSIVLPTVTPDVPAPVVIPVPDQIVKDSVPPQPARILTENERINKRITDDSIQSNAIELKLYKLISKKIAEDSIARLHGGSRPIHNPTGKNSITQINAMTFDAGQVFSTFKFVDSSGNKGLNYAYNITSAFSLGYQHISSNNLFYHLNLGLRHAGASLVNDGVTYNWNLQYFDACIGLGYMINLGRIKPYFSASPYFGYMLKANQTTGSINYDLIQNKSLKATDFGLYLSPGVKLFLSDFITFYAEYKYILGLQSIETSAVQKSYNRGFSFNLGVAITIEKQ